jgi:hypothetical protein
MNALSPSRGVSGGGSRREDGIALVITLLMLSVITFLAVAFLAMTQRDRAATTASVDVNGARAMNEAALARAQAEIMARMMAQTDFLSYDYAVSRNYISQGGFTKGNDYTTNVNYDIYNMTRNPMSMASQPADWAQNIANLYYDPRPPVFVVTNPAYSTNSDFRFWVDINRNGRFETNGYTPEVIDELGHLGSNIWMSGEPEFIGVLNDPLSHHSPSNRFIGRYAYMVLPIGKTLDLNYIHNWAKGNYVNKVNLLTNGVGIGTRNAETDGFARDQGVGSWELNLAGMLDILSPWAYETGPPENEYFTRDPYNYANFPSLAESGPNTGYAFDDAEAILHYRYSPPARPSAPAGNWPPYILGSLQANFGVNYTNAYTGIDTYCASAPLAAPFTYTNLALRFSTLPWPGSYSSNMFYEPQDLFDTNKTSLGFVNRMLLAESRTNSFDRYTFQRLLECIGTGSSPEYGVFVYTNSTNFVQGLPPTWLRTKININYDNTSQITNANAPYVPMPTNLTSWAPLAFFTNAADLLLRSQEFYAGVSYSSGVTNYGFMHFGITNIPIYNATNSDIRYNAQIHRMLQLAANIYDATINTNVEGAKDGPQYGTNLVYYPHIYRPLFRAFGNGNNFTVTIIGYTNVNVTSADWFTQLHAHPFKFITDHSLATDLNNGRDDNIWGVPWVVATVKGLPSFNQFSFVNSFDLTRRLNFLRKTTNTPPEYMSQSYEATVSHLFGLQLWNPYSNTFPRTISYGLSNFATVSIVNTNGGTWFTNTFVTNVLLSPLDFPSSTNFITLGKWEGFNGSKGGFRVPLLTNAISLSDSVYYENLGAFLPANVNPPFSANNNKQARFPNGPGLPVHSWVLNVTNYVIFYMYMDDSSGHRLVDFVNLGPFGTSMPIIPTLVNGVSGGNGGGGFPVGGGGTGPDTSTVVWDTTGANDTPNSPISEGVIAQINIGRGRAQAADWPGGSPIPPGQPGNYWSEQINGFNAVLNGGGQGLSVQDPLVPTAILVQASSWQANDPLVHYTVDDLTWLQETNRVIYVRPVNPLLIPPLTNYVSLGRVNPRYDPWGGTNVATQNNMLLKDPQATSVNAFDFPTNKFPGIGWLGRVHRGTPWQTVYFKPNSQNPKDANTWTYQWVGALAPNPLATYPTNDWLLPDLFTAVPNDNAARGLLSINQTNDAAWAAVFSGLVVPTNSFEAGTMVPTNVYALIDGPGGLNATRALEPNGLFHHLGYIFKAPALMTNFLSVNPTLCPDEIVESVPQHILSLLKVGYPQFVIYAWGQSLRPKNLYFGSGPNFNLCTNYEITGEVVTRAVCHVVSDPAATNSPRFVIDSFNIEPGN